MGNRKSVILLQTRSFTNPEYAIELSPEKTYDNLVSLGVKDFNLDRDVLAELPFSSKFSNLSELSRRYSMLRYVNSSRKYSSAVTSFDNESLSKLLDYSMCREQVMYLFSSWIDTVLAYSLPAVEALFYERVLKPVYSILDVGQDGYSNLPKNADIEEGGCVYDTFWRKIYGYSDTKSAQDYFNLVYGELIPYIDEHGLESFIYSIDNERAKIDTMYKDAVDVSILMRLDEGVDAFIKLYLVYYYSSIVYRHELISELLTVEEDATYLSIGGLILTILYDSYSWGMTPLSEILKLFTGVYGDFVFITGDL